MRRCAAWRERSQLEIENEPTFFLIPTLSKCILKILSRGAMGVGKGRGGGRGRREPWPPGFLHMMP